MNYKISGVLRKLVNMKTSWFGQKCTSSIIVVDMYSNFDDSMLADDVHYNKKGSKFIAKRYYNELKEIMIP